MTRRERIGLGFAGAEILAVGLVPAFSKYAVGRVDPLLYSAVAVTIAGCVAVALAAWRGELGRIVRGDLVVWLVPIAVLGTTATTLCLFYGARLTDGVSTALLLQVEPVYSLLLVKVFWRRTASRRQVLGTALVMAGISLVLYDGTLKIGLGGILIMLAPLGWQLSHVLALRVMPQTGPYAMTAARYVYGGAGLVLVQLMFGRSSASSLGSEGAAMALFQGVVLFFCGTLFWYETIRRLELARATALVAPCEPLMSLILVWLLLGGVPSLWQAAGCLLLAPGMWLVVTRSAKERAAQAASEASAESVLGEVLS